MVSVEIYRLILVIYYFCFFFFQAEDGIRDVAVTGVQTCALPISRPSSRCTNAPGLLQGESRAPIRGRQPRLRASSCWPPGRSANLREGAEWLKMRPHFISPWNVPALPGRDGSFVNTRPERARSAWVRPYRAHRAPSPGSQPGRLTT